MGDFDLNRGSSLRHASADDLIGLFGSDGVRAIIAINDKQWHGPIHAARGVHFIVQCQPDKPRNKKSRTFT
jgi:hypothetical protein